jgi:hypothetical protein
MNARLMPNCFTSCLMPSNFELPERCLDPAVPWSLQAFAKNAIEGLNEQEKTRSDTRSRQAGPVPAHRIALGQVQTGIT